MINQVRVSATAIATHINTMPIAVYARLECDLNKTIRHSSKVELIGTYQR